MIITEVELINHVVLGDIKCDMLGNDINSIIGRNGSGKSLFMSCLHPYSTSSRLDFVYPIKSNMSGFKRIVYTDGVKTYEIMHEYTPKNDRHSCKSYINLIENGVKTELNPTGHNDLFKTMVKKHLNYESDVATICYISATNNGLISSSSKKRREIMSTIIESDKLNSMVKNNIELLRESTAAIKILEGSKTQLLSVNGWKDKSSLDLDIVDEKIKISDLKLDELNKKLVEINNKLAELSKVDINEYNMLSFLSEITESKVSDVVSKFNAAKSECNITENYIKDLTDKLDSLKEKKLMQDRLISLNVELKSYSDELKSLNSNLQTKLNNSNTDTIITINKLFENIENIQNLKRKLTITTHCDIQTEHNELVSRIESIQSFINEYDAIKSDAISINGDVEFIKTSDKCDECYLYQNLYKNADYVRTNEQKYIRAREDLDILTYNKNILSQILTFDKDKIEKYITDLFCHSFINDIGLNVYSDADFTEIKESLCQKISRKSQIEAKIHETQLQLDNINIESNIDFDMLIHDTELKLDNIKDTYEKNVSFVKSIYNYEERFGVKMIETPQKYMDYTKQQLLDVLHTIKRFQTIAKEHNDIKYSVETELQQEQESNKQLKEDLIKYKVALERINSIESELTEKMEDKEFYLNCKEILTKDIPIHMLSSVITFIVTSVNTILANNRISLSIDIEVTEDNDIIIPVYTEKSHVPDVSAVSSGEACLISLLINAAMGHLLGYPILYLDEIDANLDEPNRVLFSKIVVSIMSVFHIDQIFCISHNISSDIITATKFLIGSPDGLTVGDEVIKLHEE